MRYPYCAWPIGAMLVALLVSCNRDVFSELRVTEKIEVNLAFDDPKVDLDDTREHFKWQEGEELALFNDIDNSKATLSVDGPSSLVDFPSGTASVYAISPDSGIADGPSSVRVTIPATQTQNTGGSLAGLVHLVAASGAVSGSKVNLCFSPLASALALNIYNENASDGEKILSVSVKGLANAGLAGKGDIDLTAAKPVLPDLDGGTAPVVVNLGTPVPVAKVKPSTAAAKREFAGQIYIVLAPLKYTSLLFEVVTTEKTYHLQSSSSFVFDCQSYDFILTGLNLQNNRIYVETAGGSIGDIVETDVTSDGSFVDPVELERENQTVDRIPDFSMVGYHYGDRSIPESGPEAKLIGPKGIASRLKVNGGDFDDSTSFIQAMIDSVGMAGGGVIRFSRGTFHVSRTLFVDYDNVVLCGTTKEETILVGEGKIQRNVISIGKTKPWTSASAATLNVSGRLVSYSKMKVQGTGGASTFGSLYLVNQRPTGYSYVYGQSSDIDEDYVPVGRMYVKVKDVSIFSVGESVVIFRPDSKEWKQDIGMDRIASNGRDDPSSATYSPTKQWTDIDFTMRWERRIVAISGNRLYFEAPVVQSLDVAYGGGQVIKCSVERVRECGVENMTIKSTYDKTLKKGSDFVDEEHCWTAVEFHNCEHCWARDIDTYYMGYALAEMRTAARCVTVQDCNVYQPVSVVSGARRYALCISSGQICLFKNCTMEQDRHGCVVNGMACGPNAYVKCTGTNMRSVMGPHQHWSSGTLYDCVHSDNAFETQDRGNSGTGHGWTSASDVYWNIEAGKPVICQSAWGRENTPAIESHPNGYMFHSARVSGRNYAIGVIGGKAAGRNVKSDYFGGIQYDYYIDGLGISKRPDGVWYPAVAVGASGTKHISLPDNTAAAKYDWWPLFTISSFSDPQSLYQCQLEDRHARGVDYSNLP